MRMWNVEVSDMCDKHLLGEHVEMHMFLGSFKKGRSLLGYLEKGFLELHNIKKRHDEIVEEMKLRLMNHNSDLEDYILWEGGYINIEQNIKELSKRCEKCKKLIERDFTEKVINISTRKMILEIDNGILERCKKECLIQSLSPLISMTK